MKIYYNPELKRKLLNKYKSLQKNVLEAFTIKK